MCHYGRSEKNAKGKKLIAYDFSRYATLDFDTILKSTNNRTKPQVENSSTYDDVRSNPFFNWTEAQT